MTATTEAPRAHGSPGTPAAQRSRRSTSPTPRPARRSSPTPAPAPAATTTTSRPSASRPTTRTSPSRCSPIRGTTSCQGWIYGFADGQAGYPLTWTKLKAWGVDDPEPVRGIGTGGGGKGLQLAGARLARVPRPQRGVGADDLPVQRQRRPADQPEHRERAARQGLRPVDTPTGSASSSAASARGCTSSTSSASTSSPRTSARRPTNMHNTVDGGEQRAQDPVRAGPGAVQPHAQRGDGRLQRRRAPRRPGTTTRSGRASASSPRR